VDEIDGEIGRRKSNDYCFAILVGKSEGGIPLEIYIYIYTHTHTQKRTHARTHAHTQIYLRIYRMVYMVKLSLYLIN
jgi:hypothetical protein